MRLNISARNMLIGAGAAALVVAGGLAAGPVASLAQSDSEADLSAEQVGEIAVAEFPDATVLSVERDDEDGVAVYEVTLSNGYELEIDGNDGNILETERDDEDGDDWGETGTLDEGDALLPEAALSPEDAVAAAQNEVEGRVDDVELERYRGDLIYAVEIGAREVLVDAMTGEVLAVHNDD